MIKTLKSLVFMFGFFAVAGAVDAAPGYLAYGDLRGHIEPCGCDPATDLGGIKRLGAVIQRERSLTPDLALFSLGNNLGEAPKDRVKNPFLAEADEALRVTAALANVTELTLLKAGKISFSAGFPLVLSNAAKASSVKGKVKSSVFGGGYRVLGYTYAEAVKTEVRRIDDQLLGEWRQAIGKEPAVLLFSGPDEDLQKITAAKIFAAVVSSNTQPFSVETSTAEKDDEARLKRRGDGSVLMVPHGGQGILRGGSLLYTEARPVSDFFKRSGDDGNGKPKGMELPFPKAKLVTWLDPASASDDGPLKGVYDRYAAAARQAFLGEGEKRLKDLKDSPFAGSQACATCHKSAAEVYAKSAHARAMETLKKKGKHEDPECVACHSVGAKEKGGFVSLAASPQFANVQCENCHGPRLAHGRQPDTGMKSAPVTLEFCVTCHNSQHSPKFNATDYWKSISHQ